MVKKRSKQKKKIIGIGRLPKGFRVGGLGELEDTIEDPFQGKNPYSDDLIEYFNDLSDDLDFDLDEEKDTDGPIGPAKLGIRKRIGRRKHIGRRKKISYRKRKISRRRKR